MAEVKIAYLCVNGLLDNEPPSNQILQLCVYLGDGKNVTFQVPLKQPVGRGERGEYWSLNDAMQQLVAGINEKLSEVLRE